MNGKLFTVQGNYSVHHIPEFPSSAVLVAFGALFADFDWWAAHRRLTSTDQWEQAKRRRRWHFPAWDRVPEQCPCSRLFFGWLSSLGSGTSLKTDLHYEAAASDKIWRYGPGLNAAVIVVCDPALDTYSCINSIGGYQGGKKRRRLS